MIEQELRTSGIGPVKTNDGGFEKTFFIPLTCTGFQGHFPGNPILPAVVQLMMANIAIEEQLGRPLEIRHINRAKFKSMVYPDSMITVHWYVKPMDTLINYICSLDVDGNSVSSFTLVESLEHSDA